MKTLNLNFLLNFNHRMIRFEELYSQTYSTQNWNVKKSFVIVHLLCIRYYYEQNYDSSPNGTGSVMLESLSTFNSLIKVKKIRSSENRRSVRLGKSYKTAKEKVQIGLRRNSNIVREDVCMHRINSRFIPIQKMRLILCKRTHLQPACLMLYNSLHIIINFHNGN